MELYTAQEVLDFWRKNETDKAKAERREIEALRKDIRTAEEYIADAIARYRKAKMKARSKAKANGEDPFYELKDYSSREDIHNAYGWELISEKEMDRLMELWDLREKSKTPNIYTDRVIEMMEAAKNAIFSANGEPILEYEAKMAAMRREAARVAADNFKRI